MHPVGIVWFTLKNRCDVVGKPRSAGFLRCGLNQRLGKANLYVFGW